MFHRGTLKPGSEIDLSAAQGIRVKLIRRDGGVWFPQSTMLADLEISIIGGITQQEFKDQAAKILSLPQALPASFRKQERRAA